MVSLQCKVVSTQWVTLIMSLILMLTSGILYSFNVYSQAFKLHFNLKQAQVNMITALGNLGNSIGSPAGMVFDRWGPKLTCFFAFLITGIALTLQYLSGLGILPKNYIFLYFIYLVIGFGSIWSYMVGIMTPINNFDKKHRGKIVGLVDSFYALSGVIFAAIYGGIFETSEDAAKQNLTGYFLFLLVVVCVINVLGIAILCTVNPSDLLTYMTMKKESKDVTQKESLISNQDERSSQDFSKTEDIEEKGDEEGTELTDAELVYGSRDIYGKELFCSLDFWIIFSFFTVGPSIALMFINNVGYVAVSLNRAKWTTTLSITVQAACCVGKLTVGFVSDVLIHKIPRTVWLMLAQILILISQVLLLVLPRELWILILTTILIGIAFGIFWTMTPTLVSEYFGMAHFGSNWGWLMFGAALGALSMQQLSSFFYQEKIASAGKTCYGVACFRDTWIMGIAAATLALVLAVFTHIRFNRDNQNEWRKSTARADDSIEDYTTKAVN